MTYSILLMQIGAEVLNYNKNKENISLFQQITLQINDINKDFSIINIKSEEINNYNRNWNEVIFI